MLGHSQDLVTHCTVFVEKIIQAQWLQAQCNGCFGTQSYLLWKNVFGLTKFEGILRNIKFATYLKFSIWENTNKIDELRWDLMSLQ